MSTYKNTVAFLKAEVPRRFFPNDVVFTHISFVNCCRVAFRMESPRDADAIFGLAPCSSESLTITACYEMSRRMAACTLELIVDAEGVEHRYEYLLTRDERLMLTEKMESFFRQRIGTNLQIFSMTQLAGQAEPG